MKSILSILILLVAVYLVPSQEKSGTDMVAKIRNVKVLGNQISIETEVSNSTDKEFFISVNPMGYDGSILSALSLSKDKKILNILSYLDDEERICSRPFDRSGVNLEKIAPRSTMVFNYYLPNPKFRIRGMCLLPPEVDFTSFDALTITIGYFDFDKQIEGLLEKQKRVHKYSLRDEDPKRDKNLPKLQKVLNLTYKLK